MFLQAYLLAVCATQVYSLCGARGRLHRYPHSWTPKSIRYTNLGIRSLTNSRLNATLKTPFLDLRQAKNRVRQLSSGRPNRNYLSASEQSVSNICMHSTEDRRSCIGTYWVLRLQKPTLHMAFDIACSSELMSPSTLNDPPRASRRFETAASVTSSFVCEDSIKDTKVANRLFWKYERLINSRVCKTKRRRGAYFRLCLFVLRLVASHGVHRRNNLGPHFFDSVVSLPPVLGCRVGFV